jgi:flavodoxin
MKVLVAYMSMTGNTKKIAEAIYGEIEVEKEIVELDKIDHPGYFNGAFVGFPMIGFAAPEEAHTFVQKHCQGKKVALFVTHGAPEHSPDLQPWLDTCSKAAAGAELVDMFNCQGELSQFIIDELLKHEDPKVRSWGEHGPSTKGQPDETRVQWARDFAKKVMEMLEADG